MTHALNGYRNYQQEFKRLLSLSSFRLKDGCDGLAIHFHIKPSRGRKNDLDNLSGCVLDCLVNAGVLTDDNWGVVKQLYCTAAHAPASGITMYFYQSRAEFIYLLEKFFTDT